MFVLLRKSSLTPKVGSATSIIYSPDRHRRGYARRASFNDPSTSRPTLHYDVLGLTPKATQGEIKAAYYKLSMTYHPDRNQGSESASIKFRQLNDAYEVLGNIVTRRRYDQGLSVTVDTGPTSTTATTRDVVDRDLEIKRRFQNRAPVPSGRSNIYDYDNWVKNHYEELFYKKQNSKIKFNGMDLKQRDYAQQRIYGKFVVGIIMSGLAVVTGMLLMEEFY